MKSTLIFILITWAGLLPSLGFAQVKAESPSAQLSHFEFPTIQGWEYKIDRKNPLVLKLNLKKDHYETLLGDLEKFKSDLIKKVTVKSDSAPGEVEIVFDLAQASTEHFDYLTDQPNRLILDFYPTTPGENKKKLETSNDSEPALPKKIKKSQKRKIASETLTLMPGESSAANGPPGAFANSLFDGSDPDFKRFSIQDYQIKKSAIQKCEKEDFLAFPMMKVDDVELAKLKASTPEFNVTKDDSEESKHAQLLKLLYERNRPEVFMKTYGWFQEKYPHAKDDQTLSYMRLEILLKKWYESEKLEDLSTAAFQVRQNIQNFGISPMGERDFAIVGYSELARHDGLGAIKTFQEFLTSFPKSELHEKVRLAIADSLAELKHDDEAETQYREILKEAHGAEQARAGFSLGDLAFRQQKYPESIHLYDDALTKFAGQRLDFPNSIFNQSMAYFQQKEFLKSLNKSRDFLTLFPSSEFAGFAMTRAGEALRCLGADPTKIVGAFLEASFRYGDTPGALVARLRLLQMRMKQMQKLELDRAINDIAAAQKKSNLPKIEQFSTMLLAEGFRERGEYTRSIELLKKYLQANPNSDYVPKLKQEITAVLANQFGSEIAKKDFLAALKLEQENNKTWLKNTPRIDVVYNLGRAFELAGDDVEAEKKYGEVIQKFNQVPVADREQTRSEQSLPDANVFFLRIAQTQAQQNKFQAAYESLRLMKEVSGLSDDEQLERVQLMAKLLHEKGEDEASALYLRDLLKQDNKDFSKNLIYSAELAEVYTGLKKDDDALRILSPHLNDDVTKASDATKLAYKRALQKLADLYEKIGQREMAVRAYGKLLEQDSKSDSVRYKMGDLQFQTGQTAKAEETWKPLVDGNTLWGKLAKDKLETEKFQASYKKYVQRIPAMTSTETTQAASTGDKSEGENAQ